MGSLAVKPLTIASSFAQTPNGVFCEANNTTDTHIQERKSALDITIIINVQ